MSEDLEVLLTTARRREHALAAVLSAVTSGNDLQTVLVDIAAAASDLFRAMSAGVFVLEGDEIGMYAEFATPDGELRHRGRFARPNVRTSSLAEVLRERSVIRFDDQSMLGDEYAQSRDAAAALGIKSSVYVPVPIGGAAVGMCVFRDEVDPFTDDDVALLQSFAAQAAHAVESARRADELRESLALQTATSEVLRLISAHPGDLHAVMHGLVERAVRLVDGDTGAVARFDGDTLTYLLDTTQPDFAGVRSPLSRGFRDAVLAGSAGPVRIDDAQALVGVGGLTHEVVRDVRSSLVAPLYADGQPFGMLLIGRLEVRPFDERDGEVLQTFAEQAAIAISNARLFNDLDAALTRQTANTEILRVISTSPGDLGRTLPEIHRAAMALVDVSHLAITYGDDHSFTAWDRQRGLSDFAARERLGSDLIVDQTHTSGVPTQLVGPVEEWRAQNPFVAQRAVEGGITNGATLFVPMAGSLGKWGFLIAQRAEPVAFDDDEIALLQEFAAQAVIALDNAELFTALETRNRDLAESLSLQTATSEVLTLISANPGDLRVVLDGIAARAGALCGATVGGVLLLRGDVMRFEGAWAQSGDRESIFGREVPVALAGVNLKARDQRSPVFVDDFAAFMRKRNDPIGMSYIEEYTVGSFVTIALFRDDTWIGNLNLNRTEVDPFDPKVGPILQSFADQAVLAIQNAGLFGDLERALELQTATSEVLRLISDNPGDLQAVFDGIVEQAARLCDADSANIGRRDGDEIVLVATSVAANKPIVGLRVPMPPDVDVTNPAYVHDVAALDGSPAMPHQIRSALSVPLRVDDDHFGWINVNRFEVRPFDERHGAIVQRFAEQAAIAIANAKLFTDLDESLELQTAIAEVLEIISSSPTELEPVLNQVLGIAARLCDADVGLVWQRGEGRYVVGANHGLSAEQVAGANDSNFELGVPHVVELVTEGQLLRFDLDMHEYLRTGEVPDGFTRPSGPRGSGDDRTRRPGLEFAGHVPANAYLMVPLTRPGSFAGVFSLMRWDRRPFTERDEAIVQTFADQALIAIENSRLFHELEESNRDVRIALEQQTAVGAVLQTISRSAFDLGTVLEELSRQATLLVGGREAAIIVVDTGEMTVFPPEIIRADGSIAPEFNGWRDPDAVAFFVERGRPHYAGYPTGEAAEAAGPVAVRHFEVHGVNSIATLPLLQGNRVVGLLAVLRLGLARFSDAEKRLLQTFADQAVIAIENARLFRELEERNREVSEALEQQTASAEVMRVIGMSPGDISTTLPAIAGAARRLCDADYASIGFLEGRSWQFWSDVDGLISLDNGGDLVAASRARPTRPTVRSMSEDRSTRGKASTR